MNRRERELLGRLYTVMTQLASTPPSNPADIKRHVEASEVMRKDGYQAAIVLSQVGFGDYADAAEGLCDLERNLKITR